MRPFPAPDVDRPHVLVVDDEVEIRDLLQRVLERQGYRVSVESDGQRALDGLADDVRLLITDLRMPRMGGLDLVRSARSMRPGLASIVITAYASTETAVEALRFGVDDFLTKPFGVDDLTRTVERVLKARRLQDQERDALYLAQDEADRLRTREQEARRALEDAERGLAISQRDLERRVEDLHFVSELQALLAGEQDLERLLERTIRVLAARFQAEGVRVDLALSDGVHRARHESEDLPDGAFAVDSDLLRRARLAPDGVGRDALLVLGRPYEVLAVAVDLATGPVGSVAIARPRAERDDPADRFLLSLVPRALAVGIEAEAKRRDAVDKAVQIATSLLDALEGRGVLPRGHGERVSSLAGEMAQALGLSPRLEEVVRTAGRLHDVGEVGIPDHVLCRPGRLSDPERELVRTHPVLGARILAPFGEAAAFVRHHHERPDGRGWPDRLRAEDIPLGAALIGCAEAYDAMTHHRSWRPSRSRDAAISEIQRLSGRQFVPEAVEALCRVVRRETSSW